MENSSHRSIRLSLTYKRLWKILRNFEEVTLLEILFNQYARRDILKFYNGAISRASGLYKVSSISSRC